MKTIASLIIVLFALKAYSRPGYWQQHADYRIEIDFDHINGRFEGKQTLKYTNNSPDTLFNVYYHLYYNAFQPGSQMDVQNQSLKDSDTRFGSQISRLAPGDQGYHRIESLKQDGKELKYEVVGTILEVQLSSPIFPGSKSTFDMQFKSQVPKILRRSGKDNHEGIDFSMAQWYPKMVEYDNEGWHANPYIAREFYGVWGNFDVKITIDSSYTIAGTGYLQNPGEIGHGYGQKTVENTAQKLSWHFIAPKVHDFAWAADPDYVHETLNLEDGPSVHFFYQEDTSNHNWDSLGKYIDDIFGVLNNTFGEYPYEQYSFIQAGDGGMEYPMATFLKAKRRWQSFFGTAVHELVHSWYYGVLATNESKHAWMDEGFTVFAEEFAVDSVLPSKYGPRLGSSRKYLDLVDRQQQESLNTIADFYARNRTYYTTAYEKGSLFLHQLRYIIGDEVFFKVMKRYFNEWKFKHPQPNDFMRIAEKESGMELDWFYHHWVETIKTIDYGIEYVYNEGKSKSRIHLKRIGEIPMPVELLVVLKDKSKHRYYIPLRIMRGEKHFNRKVTTLEDWPWTYTSYSFVVPFKREDIKYIKLDPDKMTVDVDRRNNLYNSFSEGKVFDGN